MAIRLLGIPHDCNSSFLKGAADAPPLIRAAIRSDSANMFAESGHDLGDPGLFGDAGDVLCRDVDGQAAFDAIFDAVASHVAGDDRLLSLGGDHSISFPAIMAHAERHSGLSILHFDAHPDLYEDFEGNPFSHASPFARLMESGKIARLVQVGIRTLNTHQREQAARYEVEVHEMRDLSGLSAIAFGGPVYISIDLDALDPAYAPGVSHHEPGGLCTRQVIDLIQRVPGQMVAAKLAKELAGRMLSDA